MEKRPFHYFLIYEILMYLRMDYGMVLKFRVSSLCVGFLLYYNSNVECFGNKSRTKINSPGTGPAVPNQPILYNLDMVPTGTGMSRI